MSCAVRRPLLLTGAAWLLACSAAQAAPPQRLSIPAQPMARAVLQLGAQAGVSIGAGEAATCGRSRAVNGVHEVEQALRLMLADSGCTYRRIDARTYLIMRRPPPPPRPAPPASPSVAVPVELDAVVVTATKREIDLAGAPYSLSAVDGATFDAAARRDTAALATRLAGLTVTNLGPGRNKLFVRGLADSALTGQTQAMVGLYLDDTRLTYDAPDPDLRLVDLDRVELLRGPQGTLYGAGALGGVLKLVSQPPRLDAYEGEVSAGLTFADDTAPGHSADVVFNAPLLRDRLALRVVFYEEVLEGVVDDPGLGLTNTGATARNGGRVGLTWRINDRWEARLGSVFQELHIDDSQYAFERLPPYERALSVREPSNNDFNGVSLSLTGDYGWGRARVTSAYQGHDLDRRYDATTAAARFGAGGGAPLAYDEADSIRAFALETSVSSAPGAAFGWLLGLYGSHYSHNRTGEVLDLDPDDRLYVADKRDDTNEGAIFAELAWSPIDRLKLVLGGRYFYVSTQSQTQATFGETITDAFNGQSQDDGVVSKAVVEYALSDKVLIFAQVSQGYRVGGFNGGALLNGGLDQPNAGLQPYREFRPDTLNSQELGVRWRAFDGRLRLRLAAFFVDWSAIQSDRVSADGLPFTANVGSGSNEGIELEGVWSDAPWRIDFNFMGSNPRLNAADDSYPLATDGDLPGVPKVLGAFSVRRETRIYGRQAWTSAAIGYVGRSTQQLTPEVTTEMGGYVTSEFAAGLTSGPWSATLRLDNLFSDDGDTFGYGNPFLVTSETVATPQRPRNLSLSLSRRF